MADSLNSGCAALFQVMLYTRILTFHGPDPYRCVVFSSWLSQNKMTIRLLKFHRAVLSSCGWDNGLCGVFTYKSSEKDGQKGANGRHGMSICSGGTCVLPK